MKKFLLSLATVALVGSASAETVTFDFENNDYGLERSATTYIAGGTIVKEGTSEITLNKATSGNGFRLWTDGLRVYKGTTSFTVSVQDAEITGINIAAAKTLGTCSINGDAVSYVSKAYNWTGNTSEATVTLTPTANNAIQTITITYEGASTDDRKPAEIAFDNTEYSVGSNQQYFTGATLSNPNNLPVTYTSSDETVASVTAQGIKVNGVGTTTITATFEGNDEYKPATVSYTLTVANTVSTIAQMINLADNTEVIVGCELMVGFVYNSNVFVTDGEEWIQIYGTNEYKTGDLIPAGWAAKYTLYSGVTPELMPVATLPASSTNMAAFLEYPTLGVPTAADVNKVAYFHVTFDEATPSIKDNFYGVINGTEVTFRNNYTIEGVPAGEYTDVLAVVVLYKGDAQLYVVSYEKEKAPEAVYPESLEIASDASLNIVQNGTDITITGESATDEFTVTLGIPEGWDGWLIQGDFTSAEVSPLAKVAPAEWYPVDMMTQYGFYKANSFTIVADNVKNYISAYLYKDDQVDMANGYDISVKVAKSTIVGVEEIEAAEAAAEYYTLQGVKVANPENGVYVKVCGGKAEKVVIK